MICKECGKFYRRNHNCLKDIKISQSIANLELERHQEVIRKLKEEVAQKNRKMTRRLK